MKPSPAEQPPDIDKRRAWMWIGLSLVLVVVAMLLPRAWVEPVTAIFGGEAETSAFDEPVVQLDQDLRAGHAVGDERLERLLPQVQARRLTRAGPMTADDLAAAAAIFADYRRQIAAQEAAGSKDALRSARNRALVERFPRLDPAEVDAALAELRQQVERAQK